MKEYIERELLLIGVDGCISALHAQAKGDPIQEGDIKLVEATRDYIASLSAADVVEVRHGRWETAPYNGVYDMRCSACGFAPGIRFYSSDYCPNCGTRMDKEGEHEVD